MAAALGGLRDHAPSGWARSLLLATPPLSWPRPRPPVPGWGRAPGPGAPAPGAPPVPPSDPPVPAGLLAAAGRGARGGPPPALTRLPRRGCHRAPPGPPPEPPGPLPGPAGPPPGQLPEGVEYIPTRKKGKNPMKPVGVAWALGLPCGILLFLLVKREVDRNRLEQLRIRQQMLRATQGDYETERYRRA
ncbi:U1 small nuclear ribonucleoprotein C-like [Oxyura jamaicensis]|uniref:U1 small nuclear ribonucleoprotein C-like n=1 Tax=Oxyura jamaicensis TaxID=8884 RepID=UPI0015A64F3B|nr:U1 small nuclear ribonucleoprotein C-like [Oxyura jamaicensis]